MKSLFYILVLQNHEVHHANSEIYLIIDMHVI